MEALYMIERGLVVVWFGYPPDLLQFQTTDCASLKIYRNLYISATITKLQIIEGSWCYNLRIVIDKGLGGQNWVE